MLSRRKQTNKKIKKKTIWCLAWQLDEVRGSTRYISVDKLQVDFALNLCFLNFFYNPTVVSGCNELDIPMF